MTAVLPKTQRAVQLVGPSELKLNESKEVPAPGPFEILAKIQAVGLCFSDLKVLKQFSEHVRKSEIVKGFAAPELNALRSYVPGGKPTVPGHEVVCEIVAVGGAVKNYKVGDRCLVQPDFRLLRTAGSNGAMGYNFEGGLQEFVLMDERIMVDSTGEKYLMPVEEHLGASQAALVEPWACVEDSYVTVERQRIKAGGRLLVVAEAGHAVKGLEKSFMNAGKPAKATVICAEPGQLAAVEAIGFPVEKAADAAALPNEGFDDIVYFGAKRESIDALNDKLASGGIMNVVTGGKRIGELVSVGVGRMHYGPTRWIGTHGDDASAAYAIIPKDGEVRDGDSILVVGAGGPMGQMHVIRNICSGKANLKVIAADIDDARLETLRKKAEPMAKANGVDFKVVNTKTTPLTGTFTYFAIMAPVGALVVDALNRAAQDAIVNIFAGIPAPVRHDLDVDMMIGKRTFLFGTSGSSINDMKIVLRKVTDGSLNTNASVDAISGMEGAIEGIKAVEDRTMAGKIIVYPMLDGVGLIPLSELGERFPTVAAKLEDGQWCKAAEDELLRVASRKQ